MAIEDLTNQLTMLKEQGPPDLEMSVETRDSYVRLIQDFRAELKVQRDKAVRLDGIYYPGGYPSAELTRTRLQQNVVGLDGILAIIDKYMKYLDEFEATVNAAFTRMQALDQS
jgi:hypothetical protein